jgi:hypothetical protein
LKIKIINKGAKIMIKNYRKTLWKLIEESKKGTNFNPVKQTKKLYDILNERYSIDDIEMLLQEFSSIINEYIGGKDFDKLHMSEGGIINGADDGFYVDFASWLVGQGKKLHDDYKKQGNKAILDYIEKNNITKEQYQYECIMYAFCHKVKE